MLERIIEIVRDASELMKEDIVIMQKGTESNLVTSADVKVQQYLQKELSKLLPESGFVGEENEDEIHYKEYMWVVDPIDGTTNFIRGMKASAISVGLMKENEPYIGVIYEPYKDEMFWAKRGCGAFLNGKPMHVSGKPLKNAILCAAASLYNKGLAKTCFHVIERVYMQSDDIRRFGSAAAEMAYLAAGRVDLYFEIRLFPWDMAAAIVIIEEAGGHVELIHEDKLPLDRPCGIIAANSRKNLKVLHDIVYEEIPYKMYEN